MKRSEVLAIVADQFEDIREQLDVQRKQSELQLRRTAQIQAQLDHVENLVKRLIDEEAASTQSSRERPFESKHGLP